MWLPVSVYVVRAFVHLRDIVASHRDLARRLEAHERKLASHAQAIAGLVDTIRTLMAPSEPKRRPIGFVRPEETKRV
jgi:ABC-type transporter Mla subunit MlaD